MVLGWLSPGKRKGNKSPKKELVHAKTGVPQQTKANPMGSDLRMTKSSNHESGNREAKRKASLEGF